MHTGCFTVAPPASNTDVKFVSLVCIGGTKSKRAVARSRFLKTCHGITAGSAPLASSSASRLTGTIRQDNFALITIGGNIHGRSCTTKVLGRCSVRYKESKWSHSKKIPFAEDNRPQPSVLFVAPVRLSDLRCNLGLRSGQGAIQPRIQTPRPALPDMRVMVR